MSISIAISITILHYMPVDCRVSLIICVGGYFFQCGKDGLD